MTTTYLIFLADRTIEIEADLVRENNNYFSGPKTQNPSVCFYRGQVPNRDNCVAEFVMKNIAGYAEKGQVNQLEPSNPNALR